MTTSITTRSFNVDMHFCTPAAPVVFRPFNAMPGNARPDRGISTKRPPPCAPHQQAKQPLPDHLQLGLGLRLLEDGLHLGGLHNVALDLELTRHEETLRVGLARDEALEVGIREGQGHFFLSVSARQAPNSKLTRRLVPEALVDLALA